jgi:hypothetical protein
LIFKRDIVFLIILVAIFGGLLTPVDSAFATPEEGGDTGSSGDYGGGGGDDPEPDPDPNLILTLIPIQDLWATLTLLIRVRKIRKLRVVHPNHL